MPRRRFEHLLTRIGVLRHPCDLDLLLFFHSHPHALLTTDRLAAYVGYDLDQIGRSLDSLTEARLLERSQSATHAARMYVLTSPRGGWLIPLLDIASTREGRRDLLHAMRQRDRPDDSEHHNRIDDAMTRRRLKRVAVT